MSATGKPGRKATRTSVDLSLGPNHLSGSAFHVFIRVTTTYCQHTETTLPRSTSIDQMQLWKEARTGNIEQLFGTSEQDGSSNFC